jgi:hypothetical protein
MFNNDTMNSARQLYKLGKFIFGDEDNSEPEEEKPKKKKKAKKKEKKKANKEAIELIDGIIDELKKFRKEIKKR